MGSVRMRFSSLKNSTIELSVLAVTTAACAVNGPAPCRMLKPERAP